MKKILGFGALLAILLTGGYALSDPISGSPVIGSMLKQDGTTLLLSDDVQFLNLTGATVQNLSVDNLDADTLDGLDSLYFLPEATFTGYTGSVNATTLDNLDSTAFALATSLNNYISSNDTAVSLKLPASTFTAYTGNVNAETLDNLDSTDFVLDTAFALYTSGVSITETDPIASPLLAAYTSVSAPAQFVDVTGDTMTGDLTIDGTTSNVLNVNGNSGYTYINVNGSDSGAAFGMDSGTAYAEWYMVKDDPTLRAWFSGPNDALILSNAVLQVNVPDLIFGSTNSTSTDDTFILGGVSNTTSGGGVNGLMATRESDAGGVYSIGYAGRFLDVDGDYATATGQYATLSTAADRTNAFVYDTSAVNIIQPDAFIVHGGVGYEKKVGIQTIAPQATLDVQGSQRVGVATITTTPVTLDGNAYSYFIDATSGARVANLPDCSATNIGLAYEITAFNATSSITLGRVDANDYIQFVQADYSGINLTGEGEKFTCQSANNWLRTGSW